MEIWRDLGFAARALRKSPAFAITSLVTLALGIGASTAIFSVVNAVLLRPLPYADQDSLYIITNDLRNRNVPDFPIAAGDVFDIRQLPSYDGVAALSPGRASIIGDEGPADLISTVGVTTNVFKVLGARIALGRDFIDDDGVPPPPPPPPPPQPQPGAPPQQAAAQQPPAGPPPPQLPTIGVLSHQFWQSRFGGNPNIVGTAITLGFGRVEIVGVLAPEFELLFPPNMNVEPMPALYMAARADFATGSRQNVAWRLVGRLKDGVPLQQARSEMDRLSADLQKRFPVKASAGTTFRLEPMHEDLVADVQPAILALMGGVIFVLLIACANVANLLLVRAARREREIAVRAALGGSRVRLIRQMLAEALVLAGSGALVGLGLAQLGIRVLAQLGPANLPRIQAVSIDPMVLGFSMFAAVSAAAIFGLVPALRASQPRLNEVLRAGGRSAGLRAGRWLRNGVVMTEVALSLVLLIGSGLMLRSFIALTRTDPGFNPNNMLTFVIANNQARGTDGRAAFMRQVQDRLSAIPGVTTVTAATPLPLDGANSLVRWGTEAALTDPSAFQQGIVHWVLPGYFESMGTKLIEGRLFTASDNIAGPKLVIIDQQLANMAFPGESAVGKRLLARIQTEQAEVHEVIGVVQHQRHTSLATPGEEALFVTDGFGGFGRAGRWAVRTSGDPSQLGPLVREAIKQINPTLIVSQMLPMEEYLVRAGAQTRFTLLLVVVFGVIAAVLAAVGLYGVLATSVSQRTAEIGVRMTFGASRMSIFRLVVGHGLQLSVAGVAIGLFAAFGLTRVMATMLVGVTPTDPATFASIAILFLVIAAIASWIPARRAAHLDPSRALREE